MENRHSLTKKIMLGLFLGGFAGLAMAHLPAGNIRDVYLTNILDLVGGLFINSIRMLVVPLVFVSLVCGVTSMGDVSRLGRIGFKTMAFYLVTTGLAISLALALAVLINPGLGLQMDQIVEKAPTIGSRQSFLSIVKDVIPKNPFAAMVEGNMLQIIFFALLTGISISMVGTTARPVIELFEAGNAVIMKMVIILMQLAPFGVFALIAQTFSTIGIMAMVPLIKYCLAVILALICHTGLVYMLALKGLGKLSPLQFLRNFLPAMSVAFSTASSNSTLPVTMETVEERCGVSRSVASFTLPLGATINMDGTAIMQGVAVVFVAQIYGIDLPLSSFLTVVLTATMASIGTAGVPGVGMITLAMVLESVNLPIEGVALIIGIDRLLDMARTVVNITGDAVCTLIIAKSEGELDMTVFSAANKVENVE